MSETVKWLVGAWLFLAALVFFGLAFASRNLIELDLGDQPSDYVGLPDSELLAQARVQARVDGQFDELIRSNGYKVKQR